MHVSVDYCNLVFLDLYLGRFTTSCLENDIIRCFIAQVLPPTEVINKINSQISMLRRPYQHFFQYISQHVRISPA